MQAEKERDTAVKEARFWRLKFERSARTKLKTKRKVQALTRRVKRLEDKPEKKVTRSKIKDILLKELSPFFTRTQILCFLRRKKSWTRIRGWTSSDMSLALTIHLLSPRAYRHLQRNKVLPLPGPTTLREYLRRFQIQEGFMDNVLEFLKAKIQSMPANDRIVGIMFDEVHLKKTIEYDKATDSIIGPNSSSNVVLVRGIGGKSWKIPIWFKFGFGLTKQEYLNIVGKLTEVGFHVVSSTCDMGPKNRGLAKELGITMDQPYVEHPDHPGKPVFWLFDVPHLLKLLRLHFLNSGFKLRSGTVINKEMLLKVHSAIRDNDITAGHHLTEADIHVRRQDLQSVKRAVKVMSWRTASVIRLLAPSIAPDPEDYNVMIVLSNFIAHVDRWFDVSNSQSKFDRKEMRCGLRVHHDKQVSVLEEFHDEVKGLQVIGKSGLLPWQTGICHTIKAMLLLYDHVKSIHGLEYVLTRRLNQDPLEHSFSVIRGMGACNNPGSLDFKRRFRLMILSGINKVVVQGSVICCGLDEEETVLTLDDLLNGFQQLEEDKPAADPTIFSQDLKDPALLDSLGSSIPACAATPREIAIEEGIKYVSGFLLRRAGWEDKLQVDNVLFKDDDMVESEWIDSLNTGGLSYPARSIVNDVKKMDTLFVRFHKEAPDGLIRGANVTKSFTDVLAWHFPDYPVKFLEQFSFSLTMFRLRQLRLDLNGCRESARSKKKSIDFGY